jgi:hypothetical protein
MCRDERIVGKEPPRRGWKEVGTDQGALFFERPRTREEAAMGKFLSILIGLVFVGLGVWAVIAWSPQVLIFLQAAVALMAVIIGLGILVFGLSELRAGGGEAPSEGGTPSGESAAKGPESS